VSDALSSLMIAQLAENPALDAVLTDLFDAEGSSACVNPAAWNASGPTTFAHLVAAARERGEVAIGYRGASIDGATGLGDGVFVNPPKSAPVDLGPDDGVIVIGPPS
jgi:hypothetical protein